MIDFIKAIAWPAVVVGCFVFACIYFRRQVSALLNRTTSIGREGLKASPPTGQATQEIDKVRQAHELVEALTSPVIREGEEAIRKELKDKGLEDNSETVKVLTRYLATTQLIVTFEELYRVIFGSQIFLLKAANENRAAGLHEQFVKDHFSHVQTLFAPAFDQWTAEAYVHFLLTSGLLLKESDVFRITDLGVDFLEWMIKIGAPEKKGF
jgi:hypothetical protein